MVPTAESVQSIRLDQRRARREPRSRVALPILDDRMPPGITRDRTTKRARHQLDAVSARSRGRNAGTPRRRRLDEESAWRTAALHGQYKVLVVAYFSRWSRDAEVALRIRRQLHAAGVALYIADEGFLSTDENAHER